MKRPSISALPKPALDNQPTTFIIPGATSNVVKELVLPAVENLIRLGQAENARFLFVGRKGDETEAFRQYVTAILNKKGGRSVDADSAAERIYRVNSPSFTDPEKLRELLDPEKLDRLIPNMSETRWLIHTAVGPEVWADTITNLPAGVNQIDGILVEKPVGNSEEEARAIIEKLQNGSPYFDRVRAIDHYLAKRMVDYLANLKSGIDLSAQEQELKIQMDVLLAPENWEKVNVIFDESANLKDRAEFFDNIGGIVPDMVQSHMFMVLAAVFGTTSEDGLDDQITNYLNNIRNPHTDELGQYRGYTKHPKTTAESAQTPTAIRGQFDLEVEGKDTFNSTHFRVAKGVNKKRATIIINYGAGIKVGTDGVEIHEMHIHIHGSNIVLIGTNKDGNGWKKSMPIIPNKILNMPAYARVYAGAMSGTQTATVSLDNVLKAWELTSQLQANKQSPTLYAQGGHFGA